MNAVTFLPLVYGGYWAPTIVFCLVSILMLKHHRIPKNVPTVSFLLISMLFVGLLSYFMTDHILVTNFFRDTLITLNIIFLYVSGYWIGRTNWNSFVKALKLTSVCYSVFYLIKFGYLMTYGGLSISDSQSYRIQMGAGEFIVAIGLYFYIADFRRYSTLFSTLLIIVALLSQSRTMFIYLFLLLFMVANVRIYKKSKNLAPLLMTAQITFVLIMYLSYNQVFLDLRESNSLIGKLQTSLVEILPAYYDKFEVGNFWRGFESYVALEAFKQSNIYQFLLGRGMGYAITLPYEMILAGNSFYEIPFLHNAYASLLLKFGAVGLLLFLTFLLVHLREALKDDLRVLYTATILFTLFATLVMAGPFEKNDFTHVTLLIGALAGRSIAVKTISKSSVRNPVAGALQLKEA